MRRRVIKHQQNPNIGEVKYARNCYNIMGSITSSLSSATPGKKSRWILKCLCECRKTIHTKCVGQLATEMLFKYRRKSEYLSIPEKFGASCHYFSGMDGYKDFLLLKIHLNIQLCIMTSLHLDINNF